MAASKQVARWPTEAASDWRWYNTNEWVDYVTVSFEIILPCNTGIQDSHKRGANFVPLSFLRAVVDFGRLRLSPAAKQASKLHSSQLRNSIALQHPTILSYHTIQYHSQPENRFIQAGPINTILQSINNIIQHVFNLRWVTHRGMELDATQVLVVPTPCPKLCYAGTLHC